MDSIYQNGRYLENNPNWHAEYSSWKAQQIMKMLKIHKIEPTSVCEVGCGAGEILIQLSHHLPKSSAFYGYEISPQAFALCQKRMRDRVHFFNKDIFEDEHAFFDLVLAIDVFEHVEDYHRFLRTLRTKGQYKIFHIPLDLTVRNVLKDSNLIKSRQSVGHIHYFTKTTAIATLEDTGYDIIDSFYTQGSIDLAKRGYKASLRKYLRKFLFSLNMDLTVKFLGGFSLMVLAK